MLLTVGCLLILLAVPGSFSTTTINVSNNGSDTSDCLVASRPCLSLDYAINAVKPGSSDITIAVHYSHAINSSCRLLRVNRVLITGDKGVSIYCSKLGTGVEILYSTSVTVAGIAWVNCSIRHNTTARLEPVPNSVSKDFLLKAYSAIFVYNCTDIIITGCTFTSSRGSGVSLYDILGRLIVNDTHFHSHSVSEPGLSCDYPLKSNNTCSPQSTGLYIEATFCGNFSVCSEFTFRNFSNTQYTISNCTFTGNDNTGGATGDTPYTPDYVVMYRDQWPFGRGGGFGLALYTFIISNVSVDIVGTRFINNKALYGGGLMVHFHSYYPQDNIVNIDRCVFDSNTAMSNGGGLNLHAYLYYNGYDTFDGSGTNIWSLTDTTFSSNMANWGGGLAFHSPYANIPFLSLSMERCTWTNNSFHVGAAAAGFVHTIDQANIGRYEPQVDIIDGIFQYNQAVLTPFNVSLKHVSGVVYTEGIPLHFHGNSQFLYNTAAALCVSDTGANFSGLANFTGNVGFNGGALFMAGLSWLGLTDGVHIVFIDNTAFESGGAIFYEFPAAVAMDTTKWCFIRYSQINNEHERLSLWNINVSFHGNTALNAGSAVYISNTEGCDWPHDNMTLFPGPSNKPSKFVFIGDQSQSADPLHVISSAPYNMTLLTGNDSEILTNSEGFKYIEVMPGQSLNLTIKVHDQLEQPVKTFLSIKCSLVSKYQQQKFFGDICLSDHSDYGIVHNIRMLPSNSPLMNFALKGPRFPREDEHFVLIFTTVESAAVTIPLMIEFTTCEPGYLYQEDKTCQCHDSDNNGNLFICYQGSMNTVPCLLNNYWYGHIQTSENRTVPIYHRCIPGRCSTEQASTSCGESEMYYAINQEYACSNNLTGPLCSTCPENLSLTYNAYACSECTLLQKFLLVLLILLECVLVVAAVVIFLKLNVKVSTASVYGLIYFYSVLPFLLPGNLPDPLEITILFIVDLASLEFDWLEFTQFCLFDEASAIHYEVLHFVYPVIVTLLVVLLIKIDQYCLRRFSLFSGSAAVQALCILLLMCYTAVSVTSLRTVLPLIYENAVPLEDNMTIPHHVFADPNIEYFDLRLHLPYWILAILVLSLLVLPFAVLMISAQWVMKIPRVSLMKIKPILDEYLNCFRDSCRWFAGVYLLARPILFIITALALTPATASYLQQLFCISLLLLVATVQPYQKRFHNLLDTVLLSDLTIVSFTARTSTVQQTFILHPIIQTVIVSVLSLGPFVFMLLAFIATSVRQCTVSYKESVKMRSVLNRGASTRRSTPGHNGEESDIQQENNLSTSIGLPDRFYEDENTYREGRLSNASPNNEGRGSSIRQYWRRFTSQSHRRQGYRRVPTEDEPSLNNNAILKTT